MKRPFKYQSPPPDEKEKELIMMQRNLTALYRESPYYYSKPHTQEEGSVHPPLLVRLESGSGSGKKFVSSFALCCSAMMGCCRRCCRCRCRRRRRCLHTRCGAVFGHNQAQEIARLVPPHNGSVQPASSAPAASRASGDC